MAHIRDFSRFGGLVRAYELIGYDPGRDFSFLEDNRNLRRMYPEVVEGKSRMGFECEGFDPGGVLTEIRG